MPWSAVGPDSAASCRSSSPSRGPAADGSSARTGHANNARTGETIPRYAARRTLCIEATGVRIDPSCPPVPAPESGAGREKKKRGTGCERRRRHPVVSHRSVPLPKDAISSASRQAFNRSAHSADRL